MPTHQVVLTPGINVEQTPSLNQAAFQSSNLIRFSPSGLCEKLGGWTKFYPTAIESPVTCLHAWEDLSDVLHLAVGATEQLGVITNGLLADITPQTNTTNPAPNFSTTINSNIVTVIDVANQATIYDVVIIETQVSVGGLILFGAYAIMTINSSDEYEIQAVTDATATVANGGMLPVFTTTINLSTVKVTLDNHGLVVGDTFPVEVPVAVGGLTLSDFYTVSSVIDANNFVITATTTATSSASATMNGGNVALLYYIAPGPNTQGSGYGDGGYGDGGYGFGIAPPIFEGTPITATDWTLDHFGGFLVACPDDGPIFFWGPQTGLFTAQMIANAPTANTGIFVSMSAEIIIAYGSSVLGIQDPLLINWCASGDFTDWTATVGNDAGSFRLSKGSQIIGGLQGPQYALIWTDIDLWSMTFIGQPFVFSFTELSTGCGLAAKFAAGVLGTNVFWMSYKAPTVGSGAAGQFYVLPAGGSVTPVPCSVWDFIFQTIDNANLAKIRCAVNSPFGEVTWFFPVAGGNGTNTAYVKFTPQFSCWDYGILSRSAWIDQSVFGPPIGASSGTNFIYQHETSNDADGQAMGESFTTGYWALGDGEDQIFCDQVFPDMKFGKQGQPQTGVVSIGFNYTDYPTGTPVYATPTYTMSSSGPPYLTPRFRGRLASMTVGSSPQGSWWRLGGLRIRTAPDGRL
jgi:hypothetical protein